MILHLLPPTFCEQQLSRLLGQHLDRGSYHKDQDQYAGQGDENDGGQPGPVVGNSCDIAVAGGGDRPRGEVERIDEADRVSRDVHISTATEPNHQRNEDDQG
jgi:hypothetical protein